MRVLFWGTPDFGVPSLEAMRAAGHELVAVVTNPDRPAGRGRKLTASPVKQWAGAAEVPVLQPERPRGDEFLRTIRDLEADVSVVAAYGQILTDEVLAVPRHGSINVHASVLPKLRGAAPINWAIIRGHAESGVSIMRMVLALDAGPVFRIVRVPIGGDTTAGELYAKLSTAGGEALVETLADIEDGVAEETEQDEEKATYAPKLDRDTARLDWTLAASELSCWVRGCDPWPGGWTTLGGDAIQLFSPRLASEADSPAEPGTIVSATPESGLVVATGEGSLVLGEVRPAGKRRMAAADWLRGRPGLEGHRFD